MTTTARPSRSEIEIENPVGSNAMRRRDSIRPAGRRARAVRGRPPARRAARAPGRRGPRGRRRPPAGARRRRPRGSAARAGRRLGRRGGLEGRLGRRRLDGRRRRGRVSMRATGPGRCAMTAASTCTTRGAGAIGLREGLDARHRAGPLHHDGRLDLHDPRRRRDALRRRSGSRPGRRLGRGDRCGRLRLRHWLAGGSDAACGRAAAAPPRRRAARHRRAGRGCARRSSRARC